MGKAKTKMALFVLGVLLLIKKQNLHFAIRIKLKIRNSRDILEIVELMGHGDKEVQEVLLILKYILLTFYINVYILQKRIQSNGLLGVEDSDENDNSHDETYY